MVARTLITTAIEETWPKNKSEPVLFLGDWCKRYSKIRSWNSLDGETSLYHWDDRSKLYKDYAYLQKVYEILLLSLSEQLNKIHDVNYSTRYWRILVGEWLGFFTQMLYDRWFMLNFALEKYTVSKCYILSECNNCLVSNDMSHFNRLYVNDKWNELIYAQILKEYFSNKIELIEVPCKDSVVLEKDGDKRFFIQLVRKVISASNEFFSKNQDFFFISSYIPVIAELKLQKKLGQVPKLWQFEKSPSIQINQKFRRWTLNINKEDIDDFISLAVSFIPRHIPKVYIEGYIDLLNVPISHSWPKNPRLIFTSNSYSSDDVFKCWAAGNTEKGIPLYIAQHGGHFGMSPFSFHEEHQIRISDKWLSWGWKDKDQPKIVAFGNIKMSSDSLKNDKKGGALMVEMTMPRYSYHLYAAPISVQWIDYYKDQVLFVESLTQEIQKQLTVRLYHNDYGWDQAERWQTDCPYVSLDKGDKDISLLIRKSRIYIATYNATTYLEALNLNMPTIIFWNTSHWELKEEIKPYFKMLKDVGIFHEDYKSAADHMIRVWDNIDVWWGNENTQRARRNFCHIFSNKSNDIIKDMAALLGKIDG